MAAHPSLPDNDGGYAAGNEKPDRAGNSGRRWTYELGMWSAFMFDMDFLVLRFDEDGRLFEFFWYQG